MGGTSLKLVFITYYILDKTISMKHFLLTNHDLKTNTENFL